MVNKGYYKALFVARWLANCIVVVQNFVVGDRVRIISNEQFVRQLQKRHGGWVHRMKDVTNCL